MDEDTRSRDWGYYESPSRHLGLQLRPSAVERDAKPFLSHHHHHRGGDSNAFLNNNGGYHHNRDYGVPELLAPMDFISNDSWMNHRDNKFLHGLSGNPNNKLVHGFPGNSNKLVHGNGMPTPGNPNNKIVHGMPHPGNPNKYLHGMPPSGNSNKHLHGMSDSGNHGFSLISETSNTHQQFHMQPPALLDIPSGERFAQLEEPPIKKRGASLRKQQTPKSPKAKKQKKPKDDAPPVQRAKPLKNHSTGLIINGIDLDIAGIPSPVCSCTGIPQQCYRWGCGGWQSACCTTSISMYPLPMSTKRRGARISGRKMSLGAFKKVLEKLVGEGYNLSNPIDLRTHWAKHGTNKFVTIR